MFRSGLVGPLSATLSRSMRGRIDREVRRSNRSAAPYLASRSEEVVRKNRQYGARALPPGSDQTRASRGKRRVAQMDGKSKKIRTQYHCTAGRSPFRYLAARITKPTNQQAPGNRQSRSAVPSVGGACACGRLRVEFELFFCRCCSALSSSSTGIPTHHNPSCCSPATHWPVPQKVCSSIMSIHTRYCRLWSYWNYFGASIRCRQHKRHA